MKLLGSTNLKDFINKMIARASGEGKTPILTLTEGEYNGLEYKDPDTRYHIVDGEEIILDNRQMAISRGVNTKEIYQGETLIWKSMIEGISGKLVNGYIFDEDSWWYQLASDCFPDVTLDTREKVEDYVTNVYGPKYCDAQGKSAYQRGYDSVYDHDIWQKTYDKWYSEYWNQSWQKYYNEAADRYREWWPMGDGDDESEYNERVNEYATDEAHTDISNPLNLKTDVTDPAKQKADEAKSSNEDAAADAAQREYDSAYAHAQQELDLLLSWGKCSSALWRKTMACNYTPRSSHYGWEVCPIDRYGNFEAPDFGDSTAPLYFQPISSCGLHTRLFARHIFEELIFNSPSLTYINSDFYFKGDNNSGDYMNNALKKITIGKCNMSLRNFCEYCASLEKADLSLFEWCGDDGNADMTEMFLECSSLVSVDFGRLKPGNIFSVNRIFEGCTSLMKIRCTQEMKTYLQTHNTISSQVTWDLV